METAPTSNGEDLFKQLFPEINITVAVVTIGTAAGAFMYIWKRKKSRELE